MKSLFILFALLLSSCDIPRRPVSPEELGNGVVKIQDGDIVCYGYYSQAISCLKVRN